MLNFDSKFNIEMERVILVPDERFELTIPFQSEKSELKAGFIN